MPKKVKKTAQKDLHFRIGVGLLTFWSGANLILALYILVMMTAFGINAPSLLMVLSREEVLNTHPRTIQLINTLGLLTNALIVAFCSLSLVVMWKGLMKRQPWAWWSLAITMGTVQVFGFMSDAYLQNQFFFFNFLSAVVLVAGLAMVKLKSDE